jgi:uncharacterized protein (TIGR02217 family)
MSNAVFPNLPTMAWPIKRSPRWSTRIQESVSGKETRVGFWSYPRWEYSLSFDVLRSLGAFTELQQVAGFYNARNGAYDDWLFNDLYDNTCLLQGFGTGDGSTTVFQLARAYGGYVEPVRAVNTLTQVRVNGSASVTHTLNFNTGVITFAAAPGAGTALDWSGTFYWRCRFAEDHIDFNMSMNGLSDLKSLKFRTLK